MLRPYKTDAQKSQDFRDRMTLESSFGDAVTKKAAAERLSSAEKGRSVQESQAVEALGRYMGDVEKSSRTEGIGKPVNVGGQGVYIPGLGFQSAPWGATEGSPNEWKLISQSRELGPDGKPTPKAIEAQGQLDAQEQRGIRMTGGKAKATTEAQTGPNSFQNWDAATKSQSFENFIVNNQKPTFAWRDANSKAAWEKEYNQYLIDKGKTAEGVGETRIYREAQKSALRKNEEYFGATSRFVKNIDDLSNQFMVLRKQYGVNFGKLFNTAVNNMRQGIPGSGELANLQQYLSSISLEVAKVESGELGIQAATESQQKLWAKIHNLDFNEEDIEKVLEASKFLGATRIKNIREVGDQFRRSLGEKEVKPGAPPVGGGNPKTVVKQFVSPSTGKTKVVYSDGTEEIR